MNLTDNLKVDRTAFQINHLTDASDERAFWVAQSPYARLIALEQMRQIIYGYRPTSARLQRVFEITQLTSS